MADHTPAPVSISELGGGTVIVGSDGVVVASCSVHQNNTDADLHAKQQANAAFIVRAVNCHDDLLAVCQQAAPLIGGWREAIALLEDFTAQPMPLKNMLAALDQLDDWTKMLRAAIDKTEGQCNS
jgi:hypothetical protein